MQTTMIQNPKKLNTKIVGTTFEGRQRLIEVAKSQNVMFLELEAEITNPYDSFAVAVYAQLYSKGNFIRSKLGFLSNQERVCFNCGLVVGSDLFKSSNRVSCTKCSHTFNFNTQGLLQRGDSTSVIACPTCNFLFDTNAAKVINCPNCNGEDFGRAGLATVISRAIQSGAKYRVLVTEYTGGDVDSRGMSKSLGCNIMLQLIEGS